MLSLSGQTYFVDQVSRARDFRLDWHRRNKNLIFGVSKSVYDSRKKNEDDGDHGNETSNRTFLSSSFHGSHRHLKKLAQEGLCVISEYGNPTLFITVTCNHKWPEIQERLLPGQTAFDRPDIVDQVFHQRLQAFLANIRKGVYFGGRVDDDGKFVKGNHEVVYLMHVIEYQRRGLPHAHIVVKLSNLEGMWYVYVHCLFTYTITNQSNV
jgi:hypothetical protein